MNLTFIDIVVGLILVISTVYAAWRGFLAETLAIMAWIAALFATLYLGPYLQPWMQQHIETHWLAVVAADAAMFLVIFIPLSVVSRRLAGSVRNSAIGPLDRVLGIAFGAVRGLVILGLAYLAFIYFVPAKDHPAMLAHSRTLPLLKKSASVLRSLVPKADYSAFERRSRDELGALIRRNDEAEPQSHMPDRGIVAKRAAKGYGAKDRRALDSLVEAVGSGGSGK
jgi:membrane protein required for colicin V production